MFSLEQYRALREASALLDRSWRGRLRLTGEDRRDYLQGLLTNDIAALRAGTGCYAALLTAQGRMISDMYVVETGAAILMDVEREAAARVFAHLEQFVFSEDVQVADVSDAVAQLGVFGPEAAEVVLRVLDPSSPGFSVEDLAALRPLENRSTAFGGTPMWVVRRDDIGVLGFDLMIDSGKAVLLAAAVRQAGAVEVGQAEAETTRVEAGRPAFHQDMDEETIPLEAGIEDRAISLTKGCYVGQEIIIRVLHRGHGRVARRLVGLTLESETTVPARGDRIRGGEREIGTVTSAVWSPALQRPIALGYVHRDFVEPGTKVSVASGDATLSARVTRLPFVSPGPERAESAASISHGAAE
jgi:folate-binding protein YgfZ